MVRGVATEIELRKGGASRVYRRGAAAKSVTEDGKHKRFKKQNQGLVFERPGTAPHSLGALGGECGEALVVILEGFGRCGTTNPRARLPRERIIIRTLVCRTARVIMSSTGDLLPAVKWTSWDQRRGTAPFPRHILSRVVMNDRFWRGANAAVRRRVPSTSVAQHLCGVVGATLAPHAGQREDT